MPKEATLKPPRQKRSWRSSFLPGVDLRRLAVQSVLAIFAINALFLGVRFADNLVPKETVKAALRAGYADGSMSLASYPTNRMMGRDQYSDCIAAQLAVLGGSTPARDAIAPRLLSIEQVGADLRPMRHNACVELKIYLDGRWRLEPQATYTRFWQGSASLLAAALTILPVDGYRALLLNLTLGLIALTAIVAALTRRELLIALAPLLFASFLFNGQIGYAQLFSHGPPNIALWTVAATLVALHRHMTRERLILAALLSGAMEAFLDQIISVPLVAGSFLIVAGLISQNRTEQQSAGRMAGIMTALVFAWISGFAGTYAVKLLISMLLLGPAPMQDFMAQLAFRVGTADPELGYQVGHHSRLALFGHNAVDLMIRTWRLGYANPNFLGCLTLFVFALAGWLVAICRILSQPRKDRARMLTAGIPYIVAAIFFLLWVIALPEHTMRHAFFMVRSIIFWLIGGWGWLFAMKLMPRSRAYLRDEAPTLSEPAKAAF